MSENESAGKRRIEKVIRVNGKVVVVEKVKDEECKVEYQQVEEDRGSGVRKRGKARWRASRDKKGSRRSCRVLSWADRSRAGRRRVGLPVMETGCGFEVVDSLCVYASCYADDDCSGKIVDVCVVVLVREIISQELVRGQYL